MTATTLDLSDPRFAPDDSGHGPECPFGTGEYPWHWDTLKKAWRRRGCSVPRSDCQCVSCHCGPLRDPSGWMGSCANCGRPIVVDGRVVR